MIRNLWMTTALALGCFSGVLYADNCQNDYSANDCCSDWISSEWNSLERFSFSAEGLYWKASEDNLNYGFRDRNTLTQVTDTTTTNRVRKTSKGLDFNWDMGVRLGLNYDLPCDQWDLDFNWTHLCSHASGSSRSPNFNSAQTEDLPPGTVVNFDELVANYLDDNSRLPSFSRIKGRWNLNFNNYDLDLGRSICLTECLSLRPFVGMNYLEIHQGYKIRYESDFNPANIVANNGSGKQKLSSTYSALGFQGGLGLDWNLGCGFFFYSKVGGGINYGKARAKDRYRETSTDLDESNTTRIKNKGSNWIARPNLDVAVGLKWYYLAGRCTLLTLKAGWEYHHYFDQNFFKLAQSSDPARGSLTLHGLTFGAGLDY